jgi:hypothetical protein
MLQTKKSCEAEASQDYLTLAPVKRGLLMIVFRFVYFRAPSGQSVQATLLHLTL